MIENIISLFLSNNLKIFILSMLPITELRFSIPYGYFFLNESILLSATISIIGNIIIGLLIIYIIAPIMNVLKKNKYFSIFIEKIFNKTMHKGQMINNLKMLGLIMFISIPLPLTGVWTGSLASYLFGFSKSRSTVAICVGVLISSLIISSICLFSKKLLFLLSIS